MSRKRFEELTHIGQARRLHHLAKAALIAYGLDNARAKLIKHQTNATFQIDTLEESKCSKSNSRYVQNRYLLRIHGPGYQTAAAIASELEWLKALRRDTDLAAPEPVSTLEGEQLTEASVPDMPEPRTCSLLRWMNGRTYRRPHTTHLTAIGEVMALLHNHTEGWSPPTGFTRRRLDWDGLFGKDAGFDVSPQEIWTSLPRPYAELFEVVAERVRQAMHELGDGPDVFGLIHADLHTKNILFSGKETKVIDFDDSGFGYRVYDMAVSLLQNGNPALREDFFQGYSRHRPVPEDQLEFLDTFIAARRASNAVWIFAQAQQNPDYFRQNRSGWLKSTAQTFKLFLQRH